ncbi:MAG TPA: hypothetical protein VFL99_10080 [Segeticoccus sp.]|uniref:hypothetical protein n=1 Tax=Segeticoccus sp. TaxID=2706531 RepID=UPI002D80C472|nr:hypothetical protein [Segeticoccus sp.]HET8600663.1 hypothetical protein [Segeticoccus sp.]
MRTVRDVQAAWRRFRDLNAELVEAWERLWLLNHPWLEDYLHWTPEGDLHGEVTPGKGWRMPSVTRGGWCPGQARSGSTDQSPPPSPPSWGARKPS